MAQQEVAFDLLESVENNSDENQQRGTSEKEGELLADAQLRCERRQNSHDSKEDGARKCDSRHDGVQIAGGLLAGFHTGNETAVLFHVLGNFVWIDND